MQEQVVNKGWDKERKNWATMDGASVPEFPRLSIDQLRELTLGVYQLKQARSYTQEHFSQDGSYELLLHKQCEGVLRVKIQSRHTQSKSYNLWIGYDDTEVTGWYCQCRSGARIIGCCAHTASVLWYLGYQRHLNELFDGPADGLERHLHDASDLPDSDWEQEDSDDEI
jgi:hypothetical protein